MFDLNIIAYNNEHQTHIGTIRNAVLIREQHIWRGVHGCGDFASFHGEITNLNASDTPIQLRQ